MGPPRTGPEFNVLGMLAHRRRSSHVGREVGRRANDHWQKVFGLPPAFREAGETLVQQLDAGEWWSEVADACWELWKKRKP